VQRCRLAAQAVPVHESIGRGGRGSSNRDFSRCCSCDRFVASSATTAFCDCLSGPIPVHPRLEGRGCHWFEDAEAGEGIAPTRTCCSFPKRCFRDPRTNMSRLPCLWGGDCIGFLSGDSRLPLTIPSSAKNSPATGSTTASTVSSQTDICTPRTYGLRVFGIPRHFLLRGRSRQNARADCTGVG
jgi:hypothetical protein